MEPEIRWIEPIELQNHELTESNIKTWRENGYALVSNLYPVDLLKQVREDGYTYFPAPGTEAAKKIVDFGEGVFTFPSKFDSVNQVALHPNMHKAVSQLLGVDPHEVRLTQTEVWPKYGYVPKNPHENSDQRIHCDYLNHTLVCPPPWDDPEAVEVIVYLNHVDETRGSTAVVAREGDDDPAYKYPASDMVGFADHKWVNNKTDTEAYFQQKDPAVAEFRATHLYPREKHIKFDIGTVLLYRHDTWHRGTMLLPDTLRLVINMTFKKAECDWICRMHYDWCHATLSPTLFFEQLIAKSSPEQKSLMGIPKPGHKYWRKETLRAVEMRYGVWGIDMEPYKKAVEERDKQ